MNTYDVLVIGRDDGMVWGGWIGFGVVETGVYGSILGGRRVR
jgi:hypothetical protein